MKKYSLNWTVKKAVNYMKKGKVLFDHPCQRKAGQWDDEQISLLVHSLLANYPVPPIYSVDDDENEKYSVLDGKQRLTTLDNFLKNEWKLTDDFPEVIIDGTTYDISGLGFDELPEDAKDVLGDAELPMVMLKNCTDDEIEEIFKRLNNGTALTLDQKTRSELGDRLATFIDEVTALEFFKTKAHFTKRQLKQGEDQTCILQTLMLLTEYKYKTFGNDDLSDFAKYYRANYTEEELKNCIDLFTSLNDMFEEKHKQIKKINIPIFAITLKYAQDLKIPLEKVKEWAKKFMEAYHSKCEYAQYCGDRSTSRQKVLKRIELTQSSLIDFVGCKGEVNNAIN